MANNDTTNHHHHHHDNDRSRKRRRASTSPRTEDNIHIDETGPRTKFIIGLDYGTTFSSVSFCKFDPASPPRILLEQDIKSITRWPNDSNNWRNPDVPSESWYLDNEFHWGYHARQETKAKQNGALHSRNRIIQFAKLLLFQREQDDDGPRRQLRRTLKRLKKSETEVIKDFLREILAHSKAELTKRHGFTEHSEVELAFCIPAGWPASVLRVMQKILLEITQEIGLGVRTSLFILNEPEAAAAYMLEAVPGREHLKKGDVFIVCDAGGGTVDVITYRVNQERPLRLVEVVAPRGRNCGSSYVNQALKEEIVRRLKDTEYESIKIDSFEFAIEHDVMPQIEFKKRRFDPENGLEGSEMIFVNGLRPDSRKGFGDSSLSLPREQILRCFDYSLNGICSLIQQQIDEVNQQHFTVSNILLVGGFSTSPILHKRIKTQFPGMRILDTTGEMEIAVSHGAVFRAFNKADGPIRKIQSNFGFLQIEVYNKRLPGHRAASPIDHAVDGKKYIYNVLDWVIKKNRIMKAKEPFKIRNYQTFKLDDELVIQQLIYLSDDDEVHDHYQDTHRFNRNAEVYGRLVVDLQPVKDEGLLRTKSGPGGDFYEIHYELGMEVDGRNLAVKLFCPPGGRCRGQTQLCIAAAFIPGTE